MKRSKDRYQICRTRYSFAFVERYDVVSYATRDMAVIKACKASLQAEGAVWVEDLHAEGTETNVGYAEAGRFYWASHIKLASYERRDAS